MREGDAERARRREGPGEQRGQERPQAGGKRESEAEADVEDEAVHFVGVGESSAAERLRAGGVRGVVWAALDGTALASRPRACATV